MSQDDDLPPIGLDFGEFLKLCMRKGIRPPGKNFGEPWTQQGLADAINISRRQLSNYLKNEHLPLYPNAVEQALFGPDQKYLPKWRHELREALERTKRREAEDHSTNILYEHGPTIIGGIGIAQGLVHLIWLLTAYLENNPENLWQGPWAYADLGFGVGGIVIGYACIRYLSWAQKSGICFCVAALLAGYLWFADQGNADADRLLWAFNFLNPPVSLAALMYFLFSWPKGAQPS
jgi:hypothetical protein